MWKTIPVRPNLHFSANEWVEKKNLFRRRNVLFMHGKCQPRQWKQEEWEVKINNIELLSEVKDRLIEKLTVTAPLSAVNDEMIMELSSLVKENPGNAELYFYIRDERRTDVCHNLMSRTNENISTKRHCKLI